MRVCLDTNVLVAAFATRGLCADVFRTVVTEHDLVLGQVIVDELRKVLKRKLRLPEDRIVAVETLLSRFELVRKPARPSPLGIRDPADRWVLATAVAGRADTLVTGDKDLLVMTKAPLPIMNPRAFWEQLRGRR